MAAAAAAPAVEMAEARVADPTVAAKAAAWAVVLGVATLMAAWAEAPAVAPEAEWEAVSVEVLAVA